MGKVSRALDKASSENFDLSSRHRDINKDQQNVSPTILASLTPDPASALSRSESLFTHWDERLLSAIDEDTPIADTFKRLRSKILHPAEGQTFKKILITSATPQEGKGFVCANLGVSLAKGFGQHVIMVDCDMRKPALANIFGVSNERGLADYLNKDIALTHLIKKTGLAKLSLITGGSPPDNPAELLDSKKMVALVDELAKRYDDRYILLDSPPNLVAAETAILAKYVDAVVVVVRWGGPDREEVKKLLTAVGKEKILGIVLNAYEDNIVERLLINKTKYGGYRHYYKSS